MAAILPFVMHTVATGIMVWGFSTLISLPLTQVIDTQFGGHFQFLTIQGLFVAILAMSTGALSDLLPHYPAFKTAKRAFLMVAMPLEAVIASIYWSLILLFPAQINQMLEKADVSPEMMAMFHIPLSIDLALHAVPALALLLDFFVVEEKYSHQAQSYAIPIVCVCVMFYCSFVEYCATANGHFPYPFLTNNPLSIRLAIYAGASLIAYGSFRLVNSIHK